MNFRHLVSKATDHINDSARSFYTSGALTDVAKHFALGVGLASLINALLAAPWFMLACMLVTLLVAFLVYVVRTYPADISHAA